MPDNRSFDMDKDKQREAANKGNPGSPGGQMGQGHKQGSSEHNFSNRNDDQQQSANRNDDQQQSANQGGKFAPQKDNSQCSTDQAKQANRQSKDDNR